MALLADGHCWSRHRGRGADASFCSMSPLTPPGPTCRYPAPRGNAAADRGVWSRRNPASDTDGEATQTGAHPAILPGSAAGAPLDGYGCPWPPLALRRAGGPGRREIAASRRHPPGFYGRDDALRADKPSARRRTSCRSTSNPYGARGRDCRLSGPRRASDLRPVFFVLALLLSPTRRAMIWLLRGDRRPLRGRFRHPAGAGLLVVALAAPCPRRRRLHCVILRRPDGAGRLRSTRGLPMW
ncbi:MAG: hypothetical protein HPM95_14645 [Alphaproteobacteria bacterium]|nr:hypothetical protein [Alphaproteobacteria bacterium]